MHPQDSTSLMNQRSEACAAAIEWIEVCDLDDIIPGTGVAALLRGEQIAIVRPQQGREVYALSNYDPFSKAYVMARGIVGDRAGVSKIASPIYKHNFALATGQCLDEPNVKLATYPARVVGDKVEVALTLPEAAE
jgi:nitrite reductase (NADH) small subunit